MSQAALKAAIPRVPRGQLEEVSPTNLPASVLDRFTYHRLNDDYRTLHQFCRLFMDGGSLSEHQGTSTFQCFVLDMNRLFEQYVGAVLVQAAQGASGLRARKQAPMHLDLAAQVDMKPDLVVYDRERWRLIADCKYKRLDAGDFKHHDLYQVIAYCGAAGLREGALVYPRHMVPADSVVEVRHLGTRIHILTLPLGGSLDDVRYASASLAQQLLGLAAAAN